MKIARQWVQSCLAQKYPDLSSSPWGQWPGPTVCPAHLEPPERLIVLKMAVSELESPRQRIAGLKLLLENEPAVGYRLRVAEWGVWINCKGQLKVVQSVIDEIPKFVHRTGNTAASLVAARRATYAYIAWFTTEPRRTRRIRAEPIRSCVFLPTQSDGSARDLRATGSHEDDHNCLDNEFSSVSVFSVTPW